MKVKLFQLYLGHTESQSISSWIIAHQRGFDSVEEALARFGTTIAMALPNRRKTNCHECGQETERTPASLDHRVAETIIYWLTGSLDTIGTTIFDALEEDGWELWPKWYESSYITGIEEAPEVIAACFANRTDKEHLLKCHVHIADKNKKVAILKKKK